MAGRRPRAAAACLRLRRRPLAWAAAAVVAARRRPRRLPHVHFTQAHVLSLKPACRKRQEGSQPHRPGRGWTAWCSSGSSGSSRWPALEIRLLRRPSASSTEAAVIPSNLQPSSYLCIGYFFLTTVRRERGLGLLLLLTPLLADAVVHAHSLFILLYPCDGDGLGRGGGWREGEPRPAAHDCPGPTAWRLEPPCEFALPQCLWCS